MKKIPGWSPLSAAGRALLLCFLLQQTLRSVPLPARWILSFRFHRWGNQGSAKIRNLPRAGGQWGAADCSGIIETARSRLAVTESPKYLVFVGGVKGDLSHFLVTFPHQLHGAGGQLNALQQGRLRGIPGHVPLEREGRQGRAAWVGTGRPGRPAARPTFSTGMLSWPPLKTARLQSPAMWDRATQVCELLSNEVPGGGTCHSWGHLGARSPQPPA